MIFAISLTVAILFGTGSYLMLQRNLVRMVVGIVLISNAANLFIIASGLSVGVTPIVPIPEGETASDPLVQAMVLTAIVISSSITALLLALVYRLYRAHGSVDINDLSRAEIRAAEALEEDGSSRPVTREEEPRTGSEDPERETPEESAPHPGGGRGMGD
ncbi:sodium:proton antiporter [Rubrobacter aplysinae]|uniref:sodium:proton antiporter n=1 Tax=Rubrobacter aplysinae TaxID=909625 RepID=UPI00064C077B|nr:NADH-quinone oxidoreductase subunit K [Rubrobacter aplysinae]